MSHAPPAPRAPRYQPVSGSDAAYRYHLLRAAAERFQTPVLALNAGQLKEVTRLAQRTFDLETLVLAASEANLVLIPAVAVERALTELRGRYGDEAEFIEDLARNGVDLEGLTLSLRRELTFDAVMQRVGARHASVDDIDARLFYELHRERFASPERREARHILITINEDYAENRREAALDRIERLAVKLSGRPANVVRRFGDLARAHSECPSAVEEGRLGDLGRGQLYPALDAVLFRLPLGAVGGPVETELGFHLILCERITPPRVRPYSKAKASIIETLTERRRRNCQKAWLNDLRDGAQTTMATTEEHS